jgi:hypothetical protein
MSVGMTAGMTAGLSAGLIAGCHGEPRAVFTRLGEARLAAADLRIQFNKAVDASNRAVMADTDVASVAFAREAQQTTATVQSDTEKLGALLAALGFPNEIRLHQEFAGHWSAYGKLDRTVLELAVENTNLKAQSLSFGPAREAADAVRDLLTTVARGVPTKDRCRVDALVAQAVLGVRETQVLYAPHIAEPADAAMARMEKQMAELEASTRGALRALSELAPAGASGRPALASALAAFDRFTEISKKIVSLSRRNSNVRSLALSLSEKPPLVAACDGSLRALEDALANEESTATR